MVRYGRAEAGFRDLVKFILGDSASLTIGNTEIVLENTRAASSTCGRAKSNFLLTINSTLRTQINAITLISAFPQLRYDQPLTCSYHQYAATVFQDHEHIKPTKTNGRDRKEIDRPGHLEVITQEAQPRAGALTESLLRPCTSSPSPHPVWESPAGRWYPEFFWLPTAGSPGSSAG